MSITVGLVKPGNHIYLQHANGAVLHYWAIQQSNGIYLSHRIADDAATVVTPAKCYLFYVAENNKLVRIQQTWLEEREEWKYERMILAEQVLLVRPVCVILKSRITIYAVVKEGILEIKMNEYSEITDRKVVYQTQRTITSISADRIGHITHLAFVEDGQIYYLSIEEQKITQIIQIQHQSSSKAQQVEVLSINQALHMLFVDSSSVLHHLRFETSVIIHQNYQRSYNTSNYCIERNFISFFINDQSICCFSLTDNTFVEYQLAQKIDSKGKILSIFNTQWGTQLFYLNYFDEIVHCRLINHFFKKVPSYPTLNWENIQDKCSLIGDKGYHADAYYYEPLKIVLKRMRQPRPYRALKEIKNLEKINSIYPDMSHYQLIENGTLVGLSIIYCPGQKWDTILSNQRCIFRENPVLRIKLIRQLVRVVRQMQRLGVCHGDLHLGNILIDFQSKQQFQMWLIDFGNGFIFEEGKLVSQGLNGWSLLIPIEAESKRKKDYNPSGVNAYQLGRVVLQILLLQTYQDYEKIEVNPQKELIKLAQSQQYPQFTSHFIRNLLDDNISVRNQTLMALNLENLEYEVQQISLQKSDKLQK